MTTGRAGMPCTPENEAWANWLQNAVPGLAEGAMLVAVHRYPMLDMRAYIARLDAMAETLKRRLRADISPADTLIALNHYLFDELGYSGNALDYYDERNSYLNEVMDRRVGIPITLSVLYMEVGRRLGLDLNGVSFPSHFLVKCALRSGVVVLDPYARGASLTIAELRRRLGLPPGNPAGDDAMVLQRALRTASVAAIVARILRNLRGIFLDRGDLEQALHAADRIVSLLPDAASEYRERGRIYLELECFGAAAADFRHYAALAPEAARAENMQATIDELQHRSARLN